LRLDGRAIEAWTMRTPAPEHNPIAFTYPAIVPDVPPGDHILEVYGQVVAPAPSGKRRIVAHGDTPTAAPAVVSVSLGSPALWQQGKPGYARSVPGQPCILVPAGVTPIGDPIPLSADGSPLAVDTIVDLTFTASVARAADYAAALLVFAFDGEIVADDEVVQNVGRFHPITIANQRTVTAKAGSRFIQAYGRSEAGEIELDSIKVGLQT
jgi:hypothetical protein